MQVLNAVTMDINVFFDVTCLSDYMVSFLKGSNLKSNFCPEVGGNIFSRNVGNRYEMIGCSRL
jgi:hypothetical protein